QIRKGLAQGGFRFFLGGGGSRGQQGQQYNGCGLHHLPPFAAGVGAEGAAVAAGAGAAADAGAEPPRARPRSRTASCGGRLAALTSMASLIRSCSAKEGSSRHSQEPPPAAGLRSSTPKRLPSSSTYTSHWFPIFRTWAFTTSPF